MPPGPHFVPRLLQLHGIKLHNCTLKNRRTVATWTPLAAAFNRKPEKKIFSIFNRQRRGLFGYEQLADPDGFYLMKQQAEIDTERLMREATSNARVRNIVDICDDISDTLCKVADMSECIRVLHNDPKFAEAAEETSLYMHGIVNHVNANRPLYLAIKKVVDAGRDVKPTDDVDRLVTKLFLIDFEQSGIHLEDKKRHQVIDLNAKILSSGMTFAAQCSESHFVAASLMPDSIRPCFPRDGENIVVNHVMADSPNPLVREAAYKVYLMPLEHQLTALKDMLSSRFELAKLVGFDSFAARINMLSVFGDPNKIAKFLHTLSNKLRPHMAKDLDFLLGIKRREDPAATAFYPWDIAYTIAQARKDISQSGHGEFGAYFPLGACVDGLSNLFETLYGVHFHVEDASAHEDLWSTEIYKLSVRNEDNEVLGYIYCDFYQRANKPIQDCHYTIQGGRRLSDGSYQMPKVVLSLNYIPPSAGKPCLMDFWHIDNLFHEMGHAMHSILGRTRFQHVTGTRTTVDFAEIPSTLMEHFSSDHRVLSKISRHYETGASLSEDVIQNVCRSRKKCSAVEFQYQTLFSIVDQAYHGNTLPVDPLSIYVDLHKQLMPIEYVENTAWPLRFGHLYSYGGRYYSYLLARAVASDIWEKLFKENPYNSESGKKFRDELLCHGGSKPAIELIANTLGHVPSTDELVHALIEQTKL